MKVGYKLRLPGGVGEREIATTRASTSYWYHTFEFDSGHVIPGMYNIGVDISDYRFPILSGKRVLDVGPASGWFSAYFEQEGAEVTAVEAPSAEHFDEFGNWRRPVGNKISMMRLDWAESFETGGPMGPAFGLIRNLLGLNSRFVTATPYDIDSALKADEPYDIVFAGCLLMHLRDPVGALLAMRRVCRGIIIANSYYDDKLDAVREPVMNFTGWSPILWWLPNKQCLIKWFEGAGFGDVKAESYVTLRADTPYIDRHGRSYGKTQKLRLVHAHVT